VISPDRSIRHPHSILSGTDSPRLCHLFPDPIPSVLQSEFFDCQIPSLRLPNSVPVIAKFSGSVPSMSTYTDVCDSQYRDFCGLVSAPTESDSVSVSFGKVTVTNDFFDDLKERYGERIYYRAMYRRPCFLFRSPPGAILFLWPPLLRIDRLWIIRCSSGSPPVVSISGGGICAIPGNHEV
jgi:hypothetical protein